MSSNNHVLESLALLFLFRSGHGNVPGSGHQVVELLHVHQRGHHQDLGGVFQEGGKVDGDLVLALETLLFGEAELAPPGPDQGDVDGPAEQLHVEGDPGHVLAAQHHPYPHHHGVGVSVGNLRTEASRFGVGNVQATDL